MGLSSSDVSYLKDYGSTVLENASDLDSIQPQEIDDSINLVTSAVMPSSIAQLECSGDLHHQFSGLKIPDISEPISDGSDLVQKCEANFVGTLNASNVEALTQGLKVVGTINVPLCSSISTTTLS